MKSGGGNRRLAWQTRILCLYICYIQFIHTAVSSQSNKDRFDEHLTIRPLADGRLHTFFTFVIHSGEVQSSSKSPPIYSLVPRSLIHLAQSSQAEEIHMAINAGRWNYEMWGDPGQEQMVGTGAQVRARLGHRGSINAFAGDIRNSSIPSSIMANWRKLTANLAGQFCASLDALDEHSTVQPFHLCQDPSSTILHAALASESICTENIATLLKLLPCKAMTGLASLLKPHYFLAADFHGMVLHMEQQAGNGWKVTINVQAVFSPAMKPIRQRRDWSFHSIFGTSLQQSCPLVGDSAITVLAPSDTKSTKMSESEEEANFTVWPIVVSNEEAEEDKDEEEKTLDQKAERFANKLKRIGGYTFDTRASTDLNVQMKWHKKEDSFFIPSEYQTPPLLASRIFTGYGQERGKMELIIRNKRIVGERRVMYSDVFPHFIKPYLHTLLVQVEEDSYDEEQDNIVRFQDDLTSPLLLSLNYSTNPFLVQAKLRIPPQSSIRLSIDYDKSFLRYTQHPPDAHRGFNVAPASILLEDGISTLFTEPGLIEVAVPDFSMPYNVIIFTSTLVALCAGSTLNNLLRRYTDIIV